MEPSINYGVAIATARIIAGVLFFFQGYDKIFNVGIEELRKTMKAGLGLRRVPDSLISFSVIFSSWAELLCGFLLIIGFFTYAAAYVLCLDLILVATAFSIAKPMWDSGHVFIRLVLLILILLAPSGWNIFSIDYLFLLSKLQA